MELLLGVADPTQEDLQSQTPLDYASRAGHPAIVQRLLHTPGVPQKAGPLGGFTSLVKAAMREGSRLGRK